MKTLLDSPVESSVVDRVTLPVRYIESERVPVEVKLTATRPPVVLPDPPRAERMAVLICPAARPAIAALA